MSTETLALLEEILGPDPHEEATRTTAFGNVIHLPRTNYNLRLAVTPDAVRAKEIAVKKEKQQAAARPTFNGVGKCAFIDDLFAQGGKTMKQIFDLAMAAFPDADEVKMFNNIKIRPFVMQKHGRAASWIRIKTNKDGSVTRIEKNMKPKPTEATPTVNTQHEHAVAPPAASPAEQPTTTPQPSATDSPTPAVVAPKAVKRRKQSSAKAVKREGKFAFIKELIAGRAHTHSEIVSAASARFPDWDKKLVECGVFSARTQMRKTDPAADWKHDPKPVPMPTVATPHIAVVSLGEAIPAN